MRYSLFALAAFLITGIALAAPVPDPFRSGWSTPLDLDKDCKIRLDRGTLTIELPGSDHDYNPLRKRFNAPRILRDIEGDFEIRVRVRIDCRPSAQSTVKGQPSCVSAGFLLIYPDTTRCTCDRMEYVVSQLGSKFKSKGVKQMLAEPRRENPAPNGIETNNYAIKKSWLCKVEPPAMTWNREMQEQSEIIWDRGWQKWPLPNKVEYTYLRLVHQDRRFFYFISPDGEKWAQLVYRSGPPAKLKLGLAAFSTSSEPSKVRFDQLKLTQGKKKERKGGDDKAPAGKPVKGP